VTADRLSVLLIRWARAVLGAAVANAELIHFAIKQGIVAI